MKQKLTFLLTLLVFVCTGAWATSYIPTKVKTISSTGNYFRSDIATAISENWAVYAGGDLPNNSKAVGIADSDFGITEENKNTNVACMQVKKDGGVFNSAKRVFHFLVTNVKAVKAIGNADSGRGFQIGATEYTSSTTESTSMTVVAGNSSATNPVSYSDLDPSKTYIISVFAYSSDTYLYGVRFTADERPSAPISWSASKYAATIGGSNSYPTLSNTESKTVSYSSSNTSVATINPSTGAITLSAEGKTTITATYTSTGGSDTYRTTKVNYELYVSNLTVQTSKLWYFTDTPWSDFSSVTTNTTVDNMELLADGSNAMSLTTGYGSWTKGVTEYTKCFSIGQVKSGSRQIHIRVAPDSKISVYVKYNSDANRLKISKDSKDGTVVMNATEISAGSNIYSCHYSDDVAGDLYIYNSGSNGMNIYAVKVEPMTAPDVPFFTPASGTVTETNKVKISGFCSDRIYYAWTANNVASADVASWSSAVPTNNVISVTVPLVSANTPRLHAYSALDGFSNSSKTYADYTILEKVGGDLAFDYATRSTGDGFETWAQSPVTIAITGSNGIDGSNGFVKIKTEDDGIDFAITGINALMTQIVFTYTANDKVGTATIDGNSSIAAEGKTRTWTNTLGKTSVEANLKGCRLTKIEVTYKDAVAITPSYEKITYITTNKLDFTGVVPSGLKAYIAGSASASGVHMNSVDNAPASTPLLLTGTASTTYYVPKTTTVDEIDEGDNLLKQGDGITEFDGSTYDYILYSDGKFYQIGSGTVATNKAYLHLASAPSARALNIVFDDDETTGVNEVRGLKAEVRGDYYDLSGRKVAQPTKGLYIVNGKKVIIK